MSVRAILLLAAAVACACGPEVKEPQPWMIGAFSMRPPGDLLSDEHHGRHYFDEDGTYRREYFSNCHLREDLTHVSTWEVVNENMVRGHGPDEGDIPEAIVIERLDACDEYTLHYEREGVLGSTDPVYRGEVCTRQEGCRDTNGEWLPPGECGCIKEWCDGPPEPLDCEAE